VIADSSALIALLKGEPGATVVANNRDRLSVSSVNYCETLQYLIRIGHPAERAVLLTRNLKIPVVAASSEHGARAASLQNLTRSYGLSLGDRFCIALALESEAPVLTADRIWADLVIPGLHVQLIR
jgi:ribonuclease VapC